ncbi:MAG: hypothetical protein KTV77_01700 [Wolbachia endosymbiont of Fragariocoptes setiger]|nr:hypothetical protein [Wolbachia endosymbiont of Fragariocoptes setiger]
MKLLTENGLDTSQCILRPEKIQYYLETQSQPTQADFTKFIGDKISKYTSKRNNKNNILGTSNLDSKSIESGYSSNKSETDENIHDKPNNTLSDTIVENTVEEVEITRL